MTNYESSKYGYFAHYDQSKLICPNCKNDTFKFYPQSVTCNVKYWTYEYTCTKCKWVIGVEVEL